MIYSLGFPGNIGQNRPLFPAIIDITDYNDPNDFIYNKYLNKYLTVVNRSNFVSVNMFGSNPKAYVDTVVGVSITYFMCTYLASALVLFSIYMCNLLFFNLKFKLNKD